MLSNDFPHICMRLGVSGIVFHPEIRISSLSRSSDRLLGFEDKPRLFSCQQIHMAVPDQSPNGEVHHDDHEAGDDADDQPEVPPEGENVNK